MSARKFLMRHGMLADLIRPEEELTRFLDEMDRVRAGGKGSLKMIPTYLGELRPPAVPEKITVMDIGGTNVRAGVVEMGPKGMLSARSMKPFLTPGLEKEINAETFFRLIAEGVSSQDLWMQAEEGRRLGICFSFALNPLEMRDAEVAFGAKQINVPDLVGQRIGSSFRRALQSLGKPSDQRITVINDASAAALGGRSILTDRKYGGYLGFIYGTGTNVSYCANNGEVINVESGAYCGFPTGDIDDEFDRSLIDTGQDRFEKMVSGGYQRGLADFLLRSAASEGEISESTYLNLHSDGAAALEPKNISAFVADPCGEGGDGRACTSGKDTADRTCASGEDVTTRACAPGEDVTTRACASGEGIIARSCASENDRTFLVELFDLLTDRSALLCSITLTASLIRAEAGTSPDAPAFITAEGSAFTGQKDFREKLCANMDRLASQGHGLSYEFHVVPDVTFRGTAVACL